jgi:hypothetical protein
VPRICIEELVFISPEVVAGWKNFQNGILTQEDLSCAEQTETVFTFEAKLSGKVTDVRPSIRPCFYGNSYCEVVFLAFNKIISRNNLI